MQLNKHLVILIIGIALTFLGWITKFFNPFNVGLIPFAGYLIAVGIIITAISILLILKKH